MTFRVSLVLLAAVTMAVPLSQAHVVSSTAVDDLATFTSTNGALFAVGLLAMTIGMRRRRRSLTH